MKNPYEGCERLDGTTPSSPTQSADFPPLPSSPLAKSLVSRCSICALSAPSSDDDPLRTCAECGLCMHFLCYGDGTFDDNGWRCRWCASTSRKSKSCAFCPLTEGALMR